MQRPTTRKAANTKRIWNAQPYIRHWYHIPSPQTPGFIVEEGAKIVNVGGSWWTQKSLFCSCRRWVTHIHSQRLWQHIKQMQTQTRLNPSMKRVSEHKAIPLADEVLTCRSFKEIVSFLKEYCLFYKFTLPWWKAIQLRILGSRSWIEK